MFPGHFRIAALQCRFEAGPSETLRVAETWSALGFDAEQLFHTHGEGYSAVYQPGKHGDLLRAYLEQAAARGLAVLLYMNCHILLESQRDRYEEWAQRNRDGSWRIQYGTFHTCCLNSSWVDFFIEAIGALKGMGLRGVFFDGPSGSLCFCGRCRAAFARAPGGDLAAAAPEQQQAFLWATRLRTRQRFYEAVKRVDPGWMAYFNEGFFHYRAAPAQVKEVLACNDIAATEGGFQFYGPPREVPIWRCGLSARLLESLAPDKPRIVFTAGDHKPWSWYLHTPAETVLACASTVANGASIWYGLHSTPDLLKGPVRKALRDLLAADARSDPQADGARSLADAAVFYSFETVRHQGRDAGESDLYERHRPAEGGSINSHTSFQGAAAMLFRSQIPFDLVTELNLAELARYKLLLLPQTACMSEETADALRAFVAGGGLLLADAETSLYDGNGRRREDFLLGDLFGASFRGYRDEGHHNYFTLCTPPAGAERFSGPPYLPSPRTVIDIEHRGGRIIGRLPPSLAGRYAGRPQAPIRPFALETEWGRGRCLYLAGAFFERYTEYGIPHYRQWIQALSAPARGNGFRVHGASEAVEFTVRGTADGPALLYLVNYTGAMTRPIERIVPLHDMALDIPPPWRRACSLVSGRVLPLHDGRLRLPRLDACEIILLE